MEGTSDMERKEFWIELAPATFIFLWLFNICAASGIALAKLERSIEK